VRLPVVKHRRDAAHAARLGLATELADLREALRRVGRGHGGLRIELRAGGRARDLVVGRDVLALAEERLVQRVLELAQASLLARPQARREGQRRARLVARQMDLDSQRERSPVDVPRPVDAKVVAAHLQQRLRGRPQLERQPLDLDLARVLRRLDDVRFHVRVRTDDVVVEADPPHRIPAY
jgi:hypothetical protein